jgi:hypothetical protein
MVNITIDFKNNKIYLSKPRLIKGGVYKLSINPKDKLIREIQPEVLQLLTKALDSFSRYNELYAEYEYIQYDYNRVNQSGFLKLIRNGNEIMHLSIFTGMHSTPHLTFNNIDGTTMHLYLADLELKSFNNNERTTYDAILKKYSKFKDCESTCNFFYDLLNLIEAKLDYIQNKPQIEEYYTQLKYYINAFMNILANPGPSSIYNGKYPSEKNTHTTLTNMMTADQFTEKVINYKINKKISSINAFVKSNNGRLNAFNSSINEFIKHENTSLDKLIKAIKTYKFYKGYPITNSIESAFSYTEVFQTTANIDAFIAEFEENKKLVDSVKLSPELELNSKLNSTTKPILSEFDDIVKYIANINLVFNDTTHENLIMILDIQTQTSKTELSKTKANRLEKFMTRCRDTNDDLHNLLNKNTIAIAKIKELTKSKKKKEEGEESTGQPEETTGGKTKPSLNAKTKPSLNAKTKPSLNAKTKPSLNAKTKPSLNAKTKPSLNAKTKPSLNAKTKPSLNAKTKESLIKRRTNSTTLKKK